MNHNPPPRPVPERLRWWQEARFGLSLHWGLYSIPARGEWIRSIERLTDADYQPYFFSLPPQYTWPLPDPRDTVVRFELIE